MLKRLKLVAFAQIGIMGFDGQIEVEALRLADHPAIRLRLPSALPAGDYGHTRTVQPGQRITAAEAERLLLDDLAPVEPAIARAITVPLTDGQHGALVSFAFNLGHSTAPGKPLANIAVTLNRGDYDGALRRMGLYVKQRRNGRLVTVPGLVNRRAAEAGLWARGEFVASRHVAPAAPPAEGAEAAKLGGYAAAAATAAPALQALAGVPVWIGVALVLAIAAVAVAVLLRRERAA